MNYKLPMPQVGYFPEVLDTLLKIPDCSLHHEPRKLSHPADLFMLAFSDVIRSIHSLAKNNNSDTTRSRIDKQHVPAIFDAFESDLFDLTFYSANFIEACQSIIKCLFPPDVKNGAFTKSVRDFNEKIKPYRDRSSKIINAIKHKHQRLRLFTFALDTEVIVGYFVEGIVAPNTIGPDPEVHKLFQGQRTGFSINRELPFHLVWMYYVSTCLDEAIRKSVEFFECGSNVPEGLYILECLKEASLTSVVYLPDEMGLSAPNIEILDENAVAIGFTVRKSYLANSKRYNASVSLVMKAGLKNRSFALPYFKV